MNNTTLEWIGLDTGNLDDEGAVALSKNQTLTRLEIAFNNYSITWRGAQALFSCFENRMAICQAQKLAFLMGFYEKNEHRMSNNLQAFQKNSIFDRSILKEILTFIRPVQFTLSHEFLLKWQSKQDEENSDLKAKAEKQKLTALTSNSEALEGTTQKKQKTN
jgi:hypothetical protein